MPVSLDKTPAPQPEDMDRAPAYRVELRKLTASYFVVTETTGQWTPQTPGNTVDVLSVERVADNDVEAALQLADIEMQCTEIPSLAFVQLYAVSAADAAGQARQLLSNGPWTFEDLMRAVTGLDDDTATLAEDEEEPEIESIAGYLDGQNHAARLFGDDTPMSAPDDSDRS
ncbi:hypothetical protein [Streptomyces collinus]|uniref:hypothetical protein n=1 Tax=Streptomyces collinus TaxID=42684 RepID=UPI00363140CD